MKNYERLKETFREDTTGDFIVITTIQENGITISKHVEVKPKKKLNAKKNKKYNS